METTLFDQLVGVWKLTAAEFADQTGERFHPYGQDPVGILMYSSSDWMAVQVMKRSRDRFQSNDQLTASDTEIKSAFEGYAAYFGRFTVDEAERSVIHHVEGSLFPNWEGGAQKRSVRLVGDTLTLTSPPILSAGKQVIGKLIWQRTSHESRQ